MCRVDEYELITLLSGQGCFTNKQKPMSLSTHRPAQLPATGALSNDSAIQ
jgi:hypothetical protein